MLNRVAIKIKIIVQYLKKIKIFYFFKVEKKKRKKVHYFIICVQIVSDMSLLNFKSYFALIQLKILNYLRLFSNISWQHFFEKNNISSQSRFILRSWHLARMFVALCSLKAFFPLNNGCYDNQGNVVFLVTIATVDKDKKCLIHFHELSDTKTTRKKECKHGYDAM